MITAGVWIQLNPVAAVAEPLGTVSRIDPATNHVAATITVRKVPVALAAGEGAVWVANFKSENMSRIDPRTNRVTDLRIELDDPPTSLAVGHGAVWGATYSAGKSATVPIPVPVGLLFVPVRTSGTRSALFRIDP